MMITNKFKILKDLKKIKHKIKQYKEYKNMLILIYQIKIKILIIIHNK